MRTLITCSLLTSLLLGGCDDRRASTPAAATSETTPQIDALKIETSLSAANQYLQSGEIVEAEAILRMLTSRAPSESRGHELLGQILMQKALAAEQTGDLSVVSGLRQEAYASYQRAVHCEPALAGLQHSAGLVAMAADDRAAALAHFQEAERLDPANAQYALFAAQLLKQDHRLDEAEAAIQRALALDPTEPYARATLAMIALERQQFDRALQEITIARQGLPDDVGLRAQHAKVYRHMNQPRQGLELLIGLADADRAQEAATFEIATAFDMLGEPMRAAAAWELCLQATTGAPARRAYAALQAARLYLKARALADAGRCATIAQQADPRSREAQQILDEIRATAPR